MLFLPIEKYNPDIHDNVQLHFKRPINKDLV